LRHIKRWIVLFIGLTLPIGCNNDVFEAPEKKTSSFVAVPPSGLEVPSKTVITLTFNGEVSEVKWGTSDSPGQKATDVPGDDFIWTVPAKTEISIFWVDEENDLNKKTILNYTFTPPDNDPPLILSSTVQNGASGLDPDPLNANGVVIEFNEPLAPNPSCPPWNTTVNDTAITLMSNDFTSPFEYEETYSIMP